tara:strand:+ start:301 stop:594 length:294 start_codon:yes stop_codon:yes gene_type:complete
MDYLTLIDWHCSGNSLSDAELKILDIEFYLRIENIDQNSSLEIAPPHICKASLTDEGSYWIVCFASVLDQLCPLYKDRSRLDLLLEILYKFKLVRTD